jgi:hypothetical protein
MLRHRVPIHETLHDRKTLLTGRGEFEHEG